MLDTPLTLFQAAMICLIAVVAVARLHLWYREQPDTGHVCDDGHGDPSECAECQNHEVI